MRNAFYYSVAGHKGATGSLSPLCLFLPLSFPTPAITFGGHHESN